MKRGGPLSWIFLNTAILKIEIPRLSQLLPLHRQHPGPLRRGARSPSMDAFHVRRWYNLRCLAQLNCRITEDPRPITEMSEPRVTQIPRPIPDPSPSAQRDATSFHRRLRRLQCYSTLLTARSLLLHATSAMTPQPESTLRRLRRSPRCPHSAVSAMPR